MKSKFNFLLGVMWMFGLATAHAQGTAASGTAINGSPYLNEAYEQGVIHYSNKTYKVPIRYNAFQDLIEYQQSGRAMALDPNPAVLKVTLGNSLFVPQKYESDGKSRFGYFEVLDSGKVTLFSKKRITFLPAKEGGALDGSDQPAEYKRAADVFFYKIGDGPLQEIDNIKSFIASLPDKQEELTRFAKKEKISHRKEKEIIRFVEYYNSL
ncbi:MAG TPA: hypothetical protein VIH22_11495 [Cyclobacteriaceae bacterium]|jgi:hypothetical protein